MYAAAASMNLGYGVGVDASFLLAFASLWVAGIAYRLMVNDLATVGYSAQILTMDGWYFSRIWKAHRERFPQSSKPRIYKICVGLTFVFLLLALCFGLTYRSH